MFVDDIIRSFDARRECVVRKYSYLLPVEIIGIEGDSTAEEIEKNLADFNHILNAFEVCFMLITASLPNRCLNLLCNSVNFDIPDHPYVL